MKKILYIVFAALLLAGCDEFIMDIPHTAPYARTGDVLELDGLSVTLSGSFGNMETEYGVLCFYVSEYEDFSTRFEYMVDIRDYEALDSGKITAVFDDLMPNRTYYYKFGIIHGKLENEYIDYISRAEVWGDVKTFVSDENPDDGSVQDKDKPLASSATDLASAGKTANCYIVSSAGTYKFKPVKGNSSTSVGSVSSVEVLWESFGTSQKPSEGDLIRSVNYDAGFIVFSTPSSFKEGNAVIAAKDASGEILWSWHIWLTDQPEEQVYYNNAGTMMDRNLGATSATPGDIGALGLLYQWGRKDPFLGSSSISYDVEAKSTGIWPSSVTASTSKGNVDYATANPMTFITASSSSDWDWYYSSRNNDLWTSSKTIYDPCPAGWRVPDGGEYGVWSKACDSSSSFDHQYDGTDEGMNFSGKFGSASVIWYPASGNRNDTDGSLTNSSHGSCWSASTDDNDAYRLYFNDNGSVKPSSSHSRADGRAVRCLQE